jgi:hypothetical protein
MRTNLKTINLRRVSRYFQGLYQIKELNNTHGHNLRKKPKLFLPISANTGSRLTFDKIGVG